MENTQTWDTRFLAMERPERRVASCAIIHPTAANKHDKATVMVSFAGRDGELVDLFDYYDDELLFQAPEFIGLTEGQALALFHRKDFGCLSDEDKYCSVCGQPKAWAIHDVDCFK